ncbi:unnamed protein product [Ectocarpus sp. 8 AP-2014]
MPGVDTRFFVEAVVFIHHTDWLPPGILIRTLCYGKDFFSVGGTRETSFFFQLAEHAKHGGCRWRGRRGEWMDNACKYKTLLCVLRVPAGMHACMPRGYLLRERGKVSNLVVSGQVVGKTQDGEWKKEAWSLHFSSSSGGEMVFSPPRVALPSGGGASGARNRARGLWLWRHFFSCLCLLAPCVGSRRTAVLRPGRAD